MDLLFTDESGHFCNDPIIPLYKQKIANFVNFFSPVQESEEAKRLREERLAQYESKKAKSR